MNLVLKSAERTLLSLTPSELTTLSNALNEVCNGIDFSEVDFENRVGVRRAVGLDLLKRVAAAIDAPDTKFEVADAWADGGAVMVKAISVFGDPVELGEDEARRFSEIVVSALREAS